MSDILAYSNNTYQFDSGQFTNHVVHGGWIPTMSPVPIKRPSSRDHGVTLDTLSPRPIGVPWAASQQDKAMR